MSMKKTKMEKGAVNKLPVVREVKATKTPEAIPAVKAVKNAPGFKKKLAYA